MEPETGYADLGGQRIAYQVIGDGPVDLVIAPSWLSSFDVEWELPHVRLYFQRLAEFARVIRLDRRGSGASDPLPADALPPYESFAEDIGCVMDAVESENAFLFADGDAGPLGLLFAATHPDRVRGLVLFYTGARFMADDDYPFGFPPEFADELASQLIGDWGSQGGAIAQLVPSRAHDAEFERWAAKLQRVVATPDAANRFMASTFGADVRRVLPSISAPTVVLHPREGELLPLDHGRYLAEHIDSATLVEVPGGDVYPYFDAADGVLGAIEELLTGAKPRSPVDRVLATVLFTDIVGSTRIAEEVGDRRWRGLLDIHDEAVRRGVAEHGGRLVRTTGDGVLATFDGPARAIRFATDLQRELAAAGLELRTGIHTGEIELRDDEIGGLAVHLAARITDTGDGGEIIVSRTVRDLVLGSQLSFEDRGRHALKGIDGEWELYAVVR